jgi:hypothetical protein
LKLAYPRRLNLPEMVKLERQETLVGQGQEAQVEYRLCLKLPGMENPEGHLALRLQAGATLRYCRPAPRLHRLPLRGSLLGLTSILPRSSPRTVSSPFGRGRHREIATAI